MTVRFALFLSPDGIALAHRQPAGHWAFLGDVNFNSPELEADMASLRAKGEERDGENFATLLILPDDQILYTSLTAPTQDPDLTLIRIEEGLDGLTPYPVSDLVYDFRIIEEDRVKLAVVARETLDEARSFAASHGFNSVGFAAMPPLEKFAGVPLFELSGPAEGLSFPDEGLAFGADAWGVPEDVAEPEIEPAAPELIEPAPEQSPLPDADAVLEDAADTGLTGPTLIDPMVTGPIAHLPADDDPEAELSKPASMPEPEPPVAPAEPEVETPGPDVAEDTPVITEAAGPEALGDSEENAGTPAADLPPFVDDLGEMDDADLPPPPSGAVLMARQRARAQAKAKAPDTEPTSPAMADAPEAPASEQGDAAPALRFSARRSRSMATSKADSAGGEILARRKSRIGFGAEAREAEVPQPADPPKEKKRRISPAQAKPDAPKARGKLTEGLTRIRDLSRTRPQEKDAASDVTSGVTSSVATKTPMTALDRAAEEERAKQRAASPVAAAGKRLSGLLSRSKDEKSKPEMSAAAAPAKPAEPTPEVVPETPKDGKPAAKKRPRSSRWPERLSNLVAVDEKDGRKLYANKEVTPEIEGEPAKPADTPQVTARSKGGTTAGDTEAGTGSFARVADRLTGFLPGRRASTAGSLAPDDGPARLAALSEAIRTPAPTPETETAKEETAPVFSAAARVKPRSKPRTAPARPRPEADQPRVRPATRTSVTAAPTPPTDEKTPVAVPSLRTGLILTGVLLLLLAIIAVWSAIALPDSVVARLFSGSDERGVVATSAPAPEAITAPPAIGELPGDRGTALPPLLQDPQGAVDTEIDVAEPEIIDEAAADGLDVAALETATDPPAEEVEPLPDIDADLDLPPLPPMPEDPLPSLEETERIYAEDGIWARTPERPEPGALESLRDVYIASIDPEVSDFDALALPRPGLDPTETLRRYPSPLPFGAEVETDARGLVIPTPEGVLTPQGAFVIQGQPPAPAVRRPREVTPPAPAEEVIEDAALQGLRPAPRPGDLDETRERQLLGGRTLEELALLRPAARPLSPQEEAEATAEDASLVPLDTGDAEAGDLAAAGPGDPEAEATPEIAGTALAVARSALPRARPANIDEIVASAEETPAPAAAPSQVAPQPAIPSNADVARAATDRNALRLREINLIGVTGTASDRRALVRLPSGRFVRVGVGDRLDGGTVAAIGESTLQYVRGGRTLTLEVPG